MVVFQNIYIRSIKVGVMVVGSMFLRNLIALSSNSGIQPQKNRGKDDKKKQKIDKRKQMNFWFNGNN